MRMCRGSRLEEENEIASRNGVNKAVKKQKEKVD